MEDKSQETEPKSRGIKRLILFTGIVILGIVASFFTPLGDYLSKDNVRQLASELGFWGPVLILSIGIASPLLFLPRWPIAFVSGLLYGVVLGTVLANIASTLGAWLNFILAKSLLSPMTDRLQQKYSLLQLKIPEEKYFIVLFLLRIFPLSNFVATNLFAGILKMRITTFLISTFTGMIPSTIMYAICGKLMKKPDSTFYIVIVFILIVFIISTYFAQKLLFPWLKKISSDNSI